ncbi:ABC transporter permease [Clostridium tagluense]|uniref:ABC transporter permease n=1 Tax=Clostridium tagluense TaxID=360422 RepID=UPI001C0C1389|nr:ABC transporter permease [Clostridium tagluense]MBU3128140.1 ABC transporter permease [Clostridium tagluense]
MLIQSDEHKNYIKSVKREKYLVILTRLVILIAFFSLWEIAGRLKWMDSFLTSTPSKMYASFIQLYSEGTLLYNIFITCFETVIGFVLGTILGALIAILLWWSDFVSRVLDPYLIVLNALPKVALAPIIIFWVGNGIKAIIVIALLISIVVTIISILSGFKEVDEDKIKLLKTFGASKFQILINLIIPASIGALISALKINVGLSWVGVIMGEFLVAKNGLGFLIIFGGQISQLDMVMMSIVILSLLAYLMYEMVAFIERKVVGKNK